MMSDWVPNIFYKVVVEKIPIQKMKKIKSYTLIKNKPFNCVTYMNAEEYREANQTSNISTSIRSSPS